MKETAGHESEIRARNWAVDAAGAAYRRRGLNQEPFDNEKGGHSMSIEWHLIVSFVLVLLSNAGDYWFAPPEKKRSVGAQRLTSSGASLGSLCLAYFWVKHLVSEPSISIMIWFALLLSLILAYLAIGGAVRWLLHRFVLKR
ncbi:MAG: hypothetical protein KY445_13545 [Armatimonadetes bacterium]|nr:hypothetical protein [Armatimonadota bacterium]